MHKINLITPPDIIRTDDPSWLFIFPRKELQTELQHEILADLDYTLNLYYYDLLNYSKVDAEWLFNVFELADTVVIDVDNCEPYLKELLAYFISKSKTYWLTMTTGSLYSHISNNRIYDLGFLKTTGGEIEKTE